MTGSDKARDQRQWKAIRLILPLGLLIVLSGCAVIDTSVMDSAIPLKAGEVKAITYLDAGIEQNSLVYTPVIVDEDNNTTSAGSKPDLGLKIGVGLGGNTELDVSTLAFSAPLGKASLKIGLWDNNTSAVAIMPGVYSYRGTGPHEFSPGGSDLMYRGEYKSTGVELPVLYTRREGTSGRLTLCAKLGYNWLNYTRRDIADDVIDSGEHEGLYSGLVVSAQLKLWKIVLITEGGAYAIKVLRGKGTVVPVLNLGVGIDLGK